MADQFVALENEPHKGGKKRHNIFVPHRMRLDQILGKSGGRLCNRWLAGGDIFTMQLDEITDYIRASKDVLDILKTLGGLLPKGPDADAAQQQLEQAEKALRASEAQLAKALDYHLCQCPFPPQIMLSHGHHPVHGVELFKCPGCGKQEPSEHKLRQYDRVKAHNEGRRSNSWINARRGR